MARRNSATIAEVLLDTNDETFFDAKPGDTLQDLLDRGGRYLTSASLTHVLVVETKSGNFFVGEFMFKFDQVTAAEARQIVAAHAADEQEENNYPACCAFHQKGGKAGLQCGDDTPSREERD